MAECWKAWLHGREPQGGGAAERSHEGRRDMVRLVEGELNVTRWLKPLDHGR